MKTQSLKQQAVRFLREATGRGGWHVVSARVTQGKLVVRYRSQVADLAFSVSPELNAKPETFTRTFEAPARA